MFLLHTRTGRVQSQEAWALDLFDNFITQEDYDSLLECNEVGDLI